MMQRVPDPSGNPDRRGFRPYPREVPPWLPALNPFATIFRATGRTLGAVRPSRQPLLSRQNYATELAAAAFLPWAIAAVEGGVLGVIVRIYFDGLVPEKLLNYAVAAVTAAPAFANVTSFLFARLAHGRNKVRAVNLLQLGVAACALSIALAPREPIGLAIVLLAGIGARMCLAGVITIRSAVWRNNYGRRYRATVTGRIAALQTLVSALAGLTLTLILSLAESAGEFVRGAAERLLPLAGPAMELPLPLRLVAQNAEGLALRTVLPPFILISMLGVYFWSQIRVRGHRALLRAERLTPREKGPSFNPFRSMSILLTDARFAVFMAFQFIVGVGNHMCIAPVVILVTERFDLGYFPAAIITQALPFLMIPIFVSFWSSLLDRWHIVKFRAVHTWMFVIAMGLFFAAAQLDLVMLLYAAAAVRGIAFAGGAIAWNLGHNDFATDENAAQYMSVHVTLTGIRGLVAPFVGVTIYEYLDRLHEHAEPGSPFAAGGPFAMVDGSWIFLIGTLTIATGALGFLLYARHDGRKAA